MSCDIRKYRSLDLGPGAGDLTLTAFVGPVNDVHSVQFTIGTRYCALTEKQVLDMISALANRLAIKPGWTATGNEREDLWWEIPAT